MNDLIWIVALVFLIAGTVKGTVGIGLPTASISLLSQFYDPHKSVALVIIPMILSNVWQIYRAGEVVRTITAYWRFALVLMGFMWVFSNISATIPDHLFLICLGSVVVLFSLTSLFLHPPALPDRFDRIGQVICGSLAGMMGGLTGIWSPPMVGYFVARRLGKEDFVRASGLLVFLGSLPLGLGYWQNGLMTETVALTSLAMFIPTIIGFSLGEVIRRHVDADRFQKVVLTVFLLMGLNIIRKAFLV